MKITVVIAEPGLGARVRVVENSLMSLQDLVGGFIEALPPRLFPQLDLLGVYVWVNEDGKRMGLRTNMVTADDEIVGPMVVSCANDKGGEIGLADRSNNGVALSEIVRQLLDQMRESQGLLK